MNSRFELLEKFIPYIEQQLIQGERLSHLTRHILGLFHGVTGARSWRRCLSENSYKKGLGVELIQQAMKQVAIDS